MNECFPANFCLVDAIELVATDADLRNLYDFFAQYRHREFSANERVIVFHCDTDYYPSLTSAGNNVYNLIQIMSESGISTDHVIILSNSIGLSKEVQELASQLNITAPQVIDFVLWYAYPSFVPGQVPGNKSKKFLYSCLNGVTKTHRSTMVALLYEYGLSQLGMISYHPDSRTADADDHQTVQAQKQPLILNDRFFRITQPFTRYNNDLSMCQKSKQLHIKHAKLLSSAIKHESITGDPNSTETRFVVPFLQESLIYIITETVGNYPYPWFSEKTWKSMSSMMPFMLLGPQHSLKTLRSWGFQTFRDFWDEGYDELPVVYDRAEHIVKNLCQLQSADWNQLYEKMLPILYHNFEHLKTFQQIQLDKIRNLL